MRSKATALFQARNLCKYGLTTWLAFNACLVYMRQTESSERCSDFRGEEKKKVPFNKHAKMRHVYYSLLLSLRPFHSLGPHAQFTVFIATVHNPTYRK